MLEQARIRRQAIVGEADAEQLAAGQLNRMESFPLSSSIPLIPYLSTAVLTPTPVSTPGNNGSSSTNLQSGSDSALNASSSSSNGHNPLAQSLGEMSIKDFEAVADPFEMTTLQAIDDMAELQAVLQPNSTTAAPVVPSSNSSYSSPNPVPSPTFAVRSTHPIAPPHQGMGVAAPPTASVGALIDVGTGPANNNPPPYAQVSHNHRCCCCCCFCC